MSWTTLEYELVKFYGDHRYDAYANPDKVGLGQCACGVDMYYCDHSTHFARELIDKFNVSVHCYGCGEAVPAEDAYRDGPRAFHWNDQGGGHSCEASAYREEERK